jgi:hypothetical protein
MTFCSVCGKDELLPYSCKFCNKFFCSDHRLPERHNCDSLPKREWREYKVIKEVVIEERVIIKHFTYSKCPKCGSTEISIIPDENVDNYECKRCKKKWKSPDENKEFLSQSRYHFERNPHYKKKSFWSKFKK